MENNLENEYKKLILLAQEKQQNKEFNACISYYERALRDFPHHKEPHKNIADICYMELADYEKAIFHYKEFEKILFPSKLLGHIYNILGNLYEITNRPLKEQIEYFEKAYKYIPENRVLIKNLTIVYQKAGRIDEAIDFYKRLFDDKITPQEKAYYGIFQLQAKNFEEGFKYYEYRFLDQGKINYPEFEVPRWQGEDLRDKTLLVQYEQGFGDTIMFCRYLAEVKHLAENIIFRVQDELYELLNKNLSGINVVKTSENLDNLNFDYHISLLSLMYILKAKADEIPMSEGYIEADEEKVKEYRQKYFNNDCLKIGLCWSGSQLGYQNRNINLKEFYEIAKQKNLKLYSFQKGLGAEQLKELPEDVEIIDLSKSFQDFSDTAAAMKNLDIFITSDNGVLNLAGAMGQKTFLLLPKISEWRWFNDTETTPWYNSVKIFKKQNEEEPWNILIEKVIKEIQSYK